MAIGEKGYVRGKAGRLFWPSAVILFLLSIWSVFSAALYPALLERVVISDNTAFLMAGVQTLLYTAAWTVILVLYGLRSKIKSFRVMFFLLGGLYVANAYGHFISDYFVSYILQFHGRLSEAALAIAGAVSMALHLSWIVFGVMAACHPRAGGVLRASAVVLAAANAAGLGYRFFYGTVFRWLDLRYETAVVSSLTWFLGVIMVFLTYAPVMYWLGTLSFSRMKEAPEQKEPEFPEV